VGLGVAKEFWIHCFLQTQGKPAAEKALAFPIYVLSLL